MPLQDISGKGWTPGPWLMAAKPSSVVGWPIVAPQAMGRVIASLNYADRKAFGGPQPGDRAFNAESEANGRLIVAADALYDALLGILETPLTTCDPRNPADWPRLVEFWQYELEQGRGQASFELAAYAALSLAHGEQP